MRQGVGLDYEKQDERVRVANGFLKAAVACGVAPMLLGVGILVLYGCTGLAWVAEAGMWFLLIGAGIVAMGFVCLAVWGTLEWRRLGETGEGFDWRSFWWTAALLAANFVVAVICAVAGAAFVLRSGAGGS